MWIYGKWLANLNMAESDDKTLYTIEVRWYLPHLDKTLNSIVVNIYYFKETLDEIWK